MVLIPLRLPEERAFASGSLCTAESFEHDLLANGRGLRLGVAAFNFL